MSDANVDMLAREELLELAREFAGDPNAITDRLHGGGTFTWDWPVDETDPTKGKVRVCLMADVESITREKNGVIWIRPHQAVILQQFSDGTHGDLHTFRFPRDTPLGIEPDGNPRPTLSTLINRHILSTAA